MALVRVVSRMKRRPFLHSDHRQLPVMDRRRLSKDCLRIPHPMGCQLAPHPDIETQDRHLLQSRRLVPDRHSVLGRRLLPVQRRLGRRNHESAGRLGASPPTREIRTMLRRRRNEKVRRDLRLRALEVTPKSPAKTKIENRRRRQKHNRRRRVCRQPKRPRAGRHRAHPPRKTLPHPRQRTDAAVITGGRLLLFLPLPFLLLPHRRRLHHRRGIFDKVVLG